MKDNKKKNKKLLINLLVTNSLLIGASISGVAGYIIPNNNLISKYDNVVNNVINNYDNKVNSEFIKGVDISSYASVIENFLFQNNIKKNDNSWYTYKDFDNPDIQIWDSKSNKMVSLLEYANNNLYSYFDANGNRIFANLFEILKIKGVNSIRLKIWVDPYDENGNSYEGGHNDLDTTIFIINEAKKYGFNDFLLDFHYSDFWTDPHKSYIPKSWKDLSDDEIIKKGFDYTLDTLESIYKQTGIIINRIQYGNEIDKGFLWKVIDNKLITSDISNNYNFINEFILSAIEATEYFSSIHNNAYIEKNLHFSCELNMNNLLSKYSKCVEKVDTILLSSYITWNSTLNNEYERIKLISNRFPNKKIAIAETAIAFSNKESKYINSFMDDPYNINWNSELQLLLTNQFLQFLSRLLPNIQTGAYWWEIAQIYVGRLTWATSSGIQYYSGTPAHKKWQDGNNWSKMTCFDDNGIALPTLDTINYFQRNIDLNDYNYYDPTNYFGFDNNINLKNKYANLFYRGIKFLWPKNATRYSIEDLMFNSNDISVKDQNIHIEIYLNNLNLTSEKLRNIVIEKIKSEYQSLLYSQLNFDNFQYDDSTNLGSIDIVPNNKNFYYKNKSFTLKFRVFNSYFMDTIDLSNNVISISKTDKNWYSKIINELKSQPDWAFGNQIWKYLNISGGANDNNEIWLYDNNKNVNRNAEFFLLKNDQIRLLDNTVDYDILNNNKFWIENFSNWNPGNNIVYFGIRKAIKGIDLVYNIPSTFSLVGKESWKYIDLLIYKLNINLSN